MLTDWFYWIKQWLADSTYKISIWLKQSVCHHEYKPYFISRKGLHSIGALFSPPKYKCIKCGRIVSKVPDELIAKENNNE